MNKISKRIVASVSAVALLLSAVGVDQLADLFMKTSFAVGSDGKTARSTGFGDLEQDTDDDNYNTGYGLHTNKTATALDDGRTFDVNLESWYVGENPVDVATILDASGSMAWTVNTLEPLTVKTDEKDIVSYLGVSDSDEADLNKDGKKDINDLIAFQNENGGYLPQDIVDRILDKTKTDNTKLGYDGYKYYVYEARSSVSEFVPLGYWDGGVDPKNDESLIGYYPFSGDLKNKAPNATEGAAGKLINHPASGETSYDTTKEATEPLKAEFSTQTVTQKDSKGNTTTKEVVKGLNIADSSSKGAILIESPETNKFSISFELSVDNSEGGYDDAAILYLTDGENYYKIFRAGGSSASRLKISTNSGSPLNANNAVNTEPRKWTFTFDFTEGAEKLKIETDTKKVKLDNKTEISDYTVSLIDYPKLDIDNLKIYIGGDTKEHKNQNTIYIKNLSIKDIDSDGTEKAVANYPLETEENGLKNTVDAKKPPIFVEQAYKNEDNTFGTTELFTRTLDPVFKDDKSLNVKATSQNGAISLDAVPELDDGFTISMKLYRTASLSKDGNQQNIFYFGDENTDGDYYQYFRSKNAGGYLGISKSKQEDLASSPAGTDMVYYKGGMASGSSDNEVWYTNTLVFETDPANPNKYIVTPYINGKSEYQENSKTNFEIAKISVNKDDLVLLLCALKKNGSGSNQYLDDLYVFDEALTKTQVAQYFGEKEPCKGSTTDKKLYHATTVDNKDIAQISESLAKNTKINERRGWYYVNSHSTWADVAGCLASGKQYIGIRTDDGIKSYPEMANDTATIPAGFAEGDPKQQDIAREISSGDTDKEKYEATKTERSIRFYVDSQNHLRCFVWSGDTTKSKDNKRTFCSVVYEKKDSQLTKYEELNSALNSFYQKLAENSDLSNSAVVRFSTANMVDKSDTGKTETNLKKLIMKDWTNWSDYYQNVKKSGAEPDEGNYLQDLLIPKDGEKATDTEYSSTRGDIEEYPYVMTGGTYTWTGLKAFYDNMVKKDGLSSGDRVYDIANDARDKYLIIFTDGRDNTQDYDVEDTVSEDLDTKLAGSPNYDTGSTFGKKDYVGKYNPYKGTSHKVGFSIENYGNQNYGEDKDKPYYPDIVQQFKTGDHEIATDGDLAEAWADKLKDEGYTIYCVMLATGSISESTNKDEYNKAYNFMKSLAGSNEIDEEITDMEAEMYRRLEGGTKPDEIADLQEEIEALKDDHVIVVNPNQGAGGVTRAFQQILKQIQQPREDYTVQDYIDPRFDLVDNEGNLYHLGAGGEITVTDKDGKAVDHLTKFDGSYTSTVRDTNTVTVGNVIEPKEGEATVGLAYTPRDSYMVNRTKEYDEKAGKEYFNNGDGRGTGYIYYDDEKDMYYLRWEDQVIPMEDKAFDTTKGNEHYLNVWSVTIRLKAKDDFIGGNNILTNGNEAGENLVYSDATIENMDKNPELYFTKDELSEYTDAAGKINVPYRKKLEVLSGTNRKINAVDAGGVSQAVYGNGIDIPSSGFPRTTVNVRLLKLDAKNLNDVIYMGEVISPTMMLADLEDGYMEGSYYLEYLKRYAYRLYGYKAAQTPLLDLLNQWLKIDDENELEKTFTIPYIYLPEPIYKNDNTLETEKVDGKDKVKVSNSTGMSTKTNGDYIIADFEDLNLRDVTGFITYTWKRDDDCKEDQQKVIKEGETKYDITKEYVVKNTNQIKYNLQLKFTPLHEESLEGFSIDKEKFITEKPGTSTVGDSFFNVDTTSYEFVNSAADEWVFTNRSDYLKAMVSETHTYTPHVMYDTKQEKWVLVDDTGGDDFTSEKATETYAKDDQTTANSDKTVTDTGVYDWNTAYKPVAGNEQIVSDKLKEYYTNTPANVALSSDSLSLVANTTYTKDVVNGALALELVVDGKYLKSDSPTVTNGTYIFEAIRYYDDPIDPLTYGKKTKVGADTGSDGQKYQLTFKVDSKTLPKEPKDNQIYTVWATLTKVDVENGSSYQSIKSDGYAVENALPIGTYVIETADNQLKNEQFKIGTDALGAYVHFVYLKTDNAPASYTYDKFPDSVYNVSETATASTGDDEYLIKNGTNDNAPKNIAESNRTKNTDNQTLTFYFGTVESRKINGIELFNTKGYSRIDEKYEDYAKDRLGIMLLSVDPNSLAISKEVTNTENEGILGRDWTFTVTFKPESDALTDFTTKNETGFDLKWYTLNGDGNWDLDESSSHASTVKFEKSESEGIYTAILKLKHGEKVVISGLQEGKWQVVEKDETGTIFYSAHNNMDDFDDHVFSNMTNENIQLNPASYADFVNEFPHELPSAGSFGITRYIFLGTMFTFASVLLFAILWYNRRKRSTMNK